MSLWPPLLLVMLAMLAMLVMLIQSSPSVGNGVGPIVGPGVVALFKDVANTQGVS